MPANGLFTGLSPEFGDRLDNSARTGSDGGIFEPLSRQTVPRFHRRRARVRSWHPSWHLGRAKPDGSVERRAHRAEIYTDAFPTEGTAVHRLLRLKNYCRFLFFLEPARQASQHF